MDYKIQSKNAQIKVICGDCGEVVEVNKSEISRFTVYFPNRMIYLQDLSRMKCKCCGSMTNIIPFGLQFCAVNCVFMRSDYKIEKAWNVMDNNTIFKFNQKIGIKQLVPC